ncbi:MAG: hypothetical protein FH761_09765 [Firmicutes bacterium]|nr:hypothetical protein [Bacillota bacterium]
MDYIVELILFILIVVILIFSPDIRLFLIKKVSTPYFIKKAFIKLRKGKQDIFILGTISDEHLENDRYSLLHIDAVIRNLRPDILLLENRPEEIERDNLADGSIEMLFGALTAKELGIDFDGIDWWIENDIKPGEMSSERTIKIKSNILKKSKGYSKVLILAEYSNINKIIAGMRKESYSRVKMDNIERDNILKTKSTKLIFPKGMKYYLEKRIEIEREAAELTPSADWRIAYLDSADAREDLINTVNKIGEKDI